jgi:hypothetical protein
VEGVPKEQGGGRLGQGEGQGEGEGEGEGDDVGAISTSDRVCDDEGGTAENEIFRGGGF